MENEPKKRFSMALISIPSTIGGVTIPGTASSGPLGALFGSQYSLSNLQYPRDLGSMTKGHVVQFSLFERKAQTYDSITTSTSNLINSTNIEEAKAAGGQLLDALGTVGGNITDAVVNVAKSSNSSVLSISRENSGPPEIISLYMPDTVNITNGATYSGPISSVGAIAEAVGLAGKISKAVVGDNLVGNALGAAGSLPGVALSALNSNPAKLLLQTQGLALNPTETSN